MRVRTVVVILAIVLLAVFTALNWPAFIAPTRLDLIVATVEAPLGLLMLGLLALLTLLFAAYMAMWQGSVLLETRRNAKELQQQRTLADQAEASRFNELRNALRDEGKALDQRIADLRTHLRADLQEHTNSLASMIGEMDDRLQPPGPR